MADMRVCMIRFSVSVQVSRVDVSAPLLRCGLRGSTLLACSVAEFVASLGLGSAVGLAVVSSTGSAAVSVLLSGAASTTWSGSGGVGFWVGGEIRVQNR